MFSHQTPSHLWLSDDPWSRYIVLTLDGSESQVESALLNLQCLMKKIEEVEVSQQPTAYTSADSPLITSADISAAFQRLEKGWDAHGHTRSGNVATASRFLPCHYFDFIAGSSTGGLVALMLGRLRMSVDTVLEAYRLIMRQMKQLRPVSRKRRILDLKARFRSSTLRKDKDSITNEIIKILGHQSDSIRSNRDLCQTILLSYKDKVRGDMVPYAFTSYVSDKMLTKDIDCSIGDLVRGICCSPYRFQKSEINGEIFCDTGSSITNPTELVRSNLQRLVDAEVDDTEITSIGMVVSIGCRPVNSMGTKAQSSKSTWTRSNRPTESVETRSSQKSSELVHESIQKRDEFAYYRINGNSQYFTTTPHDVETTLALTARELVTIRRLRSETSKWESFAFGWSYTCIPCENKGVRDLEFKSRGYLMDHLFRRHKFPPIDSQHFEKLKYLIEKRTSNDGLTPM